MLQSTLARILLTPFALLYGAGVSLRNFFYRRGLLRSVAFDVPVISVGNLSVGGAGKTPHIEWLVRLFNPYLNVATLSRGYKRKTRGFLEVKPEHDASQSGDEPLQFKRKFPDIYVAVSESRTYGIPEIMRHRPATQVVLLDDAFQHRAVVPGLNILLTEYSHPFTDDFLLPAGRLREWRSAYHRADVLIVSKCPATLTPADRARFLEKLNPLPHQRVFFSYYAYGQPYYLFNRRYVAHLPPDCDVLLISAIARTDYLKAHLEARVNQVISLEYEDHHNFKPFEIGHLKKVFDNMGNEKRLILTTEKDAMRLELHRDFLLEHRLPVFAIPVEVKFHFDGETELGELAKTFMLNFRG